MVDHFKFAKFKFTLTAQEDIILPEYKGAVFRGGFGYAFKKIVCVQRSNSDCQNCMLQQNCVYSYIFETPCPKDSKVLRLYKTVPHPFVIEPPSGSTNVIPKDHQTEFNLVLIGKAIEYLPYFIFTFNELGKTGIGKNRSKFVLKEVKAETIDGKHQPVYDNENQTIQNGFPVLDAGQLNRENDLGGDREIELEFLTPFRVRFDGKITAGIEFHIMVRSLLRRVSSLSYFHCGVELDWDFKSLIEAAKEVRKVKSSLHWYDWERYSTRQKQKMSLGGALGAVTFEGDIKPFKQLLRLGEFVHVGKGTSFGLGKYQIGRY
ncbi:MAG: CRISPR system precrRNA processing endoribonuclease RAMP protein Cas6 [Candidatus Anammoxibacter sp.]